MKINRQKITFLMSIIFGATALAPSAHARSIPAIAGRTLYAADGNCFVDRAGYQGIMINNCGRDVWFDIPLSTDSSPATYGVTVTARGETAPQSTVGCVAFGFFNSGGTVFWYSSGSLRYLPVLGSTATIQMSTYVPPEGALFAECMVNAGAQIAYVNW